jgi:hypothetical protein
MNTKILAHFSEMSTSMKKYSGLFKDVEVTILLILTIPFHRDQRVTKRCRLSLLTNSALVCESQCGGMGGGGVAGSQPQSTHRARIFKRLWSPGIDSK